MRIFFRFTYHGLLFFAINHIGRLTHYARNPFLSKLPQCLPDILHRFPCRCQFSQNCWTCKSAFYVPSGKCFPHRLFNRTDGLLTGFCINSTKAYCQNRISAHGIAPFNGCCIDCCDCIENAHKLRPSAK